MCDNWPTITVTDIDITVDGMKCCNILRELVNCKSGLLQKLFVSISVTCPQSMGKEEVIFKYNYIKSLH
jgi:hypothetical protein